MKAFKVLNNQSGMMAMMAAMIFTIAITTTLSTFYVYTLNQAKYHARIKEAYQLINIMESFATATRKAYDMGMSAKAKNEGCPGGGAIVEIGTTATNYYCRPNVPTCFLREDTNEQYCTVINFASNVEIQRQPMNASNDSNSFLKSWRKGLNNFFISPGIKDRIVDTSTMAYVIQKPMLLDWLISTAQATENEKNPDRNKYTQGTKKIDDTKIPETTSSVESPPATPTVISRPSPPIVIGTPEPIPSSTGFINCATGEICTYSSNVSTGKSDSSSSQCDPRQMVPSEKASFCNNCTDGNQFCPSTGAGQDGQGRIQVRSHGGEGEVKTLPIRQKFSIVM